jgi:hypothetical protein
MRARARRLRRLLARGPLTAGEINAETSGYVGLWLDLVRIPPSGTWERRRADVFAAAEDWLGPNRATEAEGLELLVRRYLGAFGPAPLADIASWSGVLPRRLAPAVERLRLRRFRDETGRDLFDLRRAPLPPADTPAPVRFLPVWDATLLVHARRTGILPEKYRPLLFSAKNPASANTFLVDGVVAGTWRYRDGRVRLEPFRRLSPATRRELENEGGRLGELHR